MGMMRLQVIIIAVVVVQSGLALRWYLRHPGKRREETETMTLRATGHAINSAGISCSVMKPRGSLISLARQLSLHLHFITLSRSIDLPSPSFSPCMRYSTTLYRAHRFLTSIEIKKPLNPILIAHDFSRQNDVLSLPPESCAGLLGIHRPSQSGNNRRRDPRLRTRIPQPVPR